MNCPQAQRLGQWAATLCSWPAVAVCLAVTPPATASAEQIKGRVEKSGAGLAGVTVLVNETRESTITDRTGRFALQVRPGTYTLTLALGDQLATREDVRVGEGASVEVMIEVPWVIGFVDTITVQSASRRPERIIDAPAAVTTVPAERIALGAAAGQLPRLLRGGVGIETPQSSLYDFNVNTRGVNGFLTRRIQTIVDGRDPSNPATSAPEWWNIDLIADEIASAELTRGPSAALYGPNSFNGVLNIVTTTPRQSQGATARLTAGSRDTVKVHGRWAGAIGRNWYVKAIGQQTRSDDFSASRNEAVEYQGLQLEAVPLTPPRVDVSAGTVRVDRDGGEGRALVLEAGVAGGSGAVFITPASRGQQHDTSWTWARANFHTSAWTVSASFNRRSGESTLLSVGAPLFDDGRAFAVDAQVHDYRLGGRLRLVGGASYTRRTIDSANDQGVQTLFLHAITSHQGALFGQADFDLTPKVKLVGAARFDESTLHDAQISPKASLVYAIDSQHRLRIGYNRAFQVPTYTELFVNVPAAPPLDLSVVEAPLAPLLGGATLGFNSVPIRVVGNPDLAVEQVQAIDVGYSGVVGRRMLLTADYYYNRMRDFISGFLPGVNPQFGPYRAPSLLPPVIAGGFEAAVNAAIPGLTVVDGRPMVVLSTTNFGRARAHGLELSTGYYVGSRWRFDASYTWFHFNLDDDSPGAPTVFANAPAHTLKTGGTFANARLLAGLEARWVDSFTWSSGVFSGPVPSYALVDAAARVTVTKHVQVGVTVDNLFDKVHYEMFGGNLLRRFAVGYAAMTF